MKNLRTPLSIAAFALLGFSAQAQLDVPAPSPAAVLTQKFGLTEVKVEYSRPSAKGRKIMGDVVPFGAIWRTGANSATKFTTTDSITIMGQGLPKGTYVLLTRPNKDKWEVIFNKNMNVSAFDYKPSDDVVRVSVPAQTLPFNVESFTISIGDLNNTSASLELMWENTVVRVPMTNDIDKKIMAQIEQKLAGPTGNDYFAMSQYYYDTNKDDKKALEYVNKALEKGVRFWILRHKSLVQARLGDKKGAIETAKESLRLAKEANNQDYVRMNEKSISEWSK